MKNFVDRSEDLGKSGGKKCNFDKEVRRKVIALKKDKWNFLRNIG